MTSQLLGFCSGLMEAGMPGTPFVMRRHDGIFSSSSQKGLIKI